MGQVNPARIIAAKCIPPSAITPLDVRLRHVFRIARGASDVRYNLLVRRKRRDARASARPHRS